MDYEDRTHAHLVAAIEVLVEHVAGEGLRAGRDGVEVTAMGRGGEDFNTAMVTRRPDDPAAAVAWACGSLAGRGRAQVIQVPAPVLDDELAVALSGAGLLLTDEVPGMALALPAAAPRDLVALHVVVVSDQGELDACALATARGFGAPDPTTSLGHFPVSLLRDPRVAFLTGFIAGRVDPVATAVVVVTDGVAGIYSVTTAPDARGAGVGTAITWAAAERGCDLGADLAVLQASPMGRPVYERMGFQPVCDYLRFGLPAPQ